MQSGYCQWQKEKAPKEQVKEIRNLLVRPFPYKMAVKMKSYRKYFLKGTSQFICCKFSRQP
jgi:hypothetical protein